MSVAERINAALGGRHYVDAPTAAAEFAARELQRILAKRNPTELYIVCPSTRMPVCMGEFTHRYGERRPCPSCEGAHLIPYLHSDRLENLKALQGLLATFVDQAANDVRDAQVAVGASRFTAHEVARLRRNKGMEFATLPGESEWLYRHWDFTPQPIGRER